MRFGTWIDQMCREHPELMRPLLTERIRLEYYCLPDGCGCIVGTPLIAFARRSGTFELLLSVEHHNGEPVRDAIWYRFAALSGSAVGDLEHLAESHLNAVIQRLQWRRLNASAPPSHWTAWREAQEQLIQMVRDRVRRRLEAAPEPQIQEVMIT